MAGIGGRTRGTRQGNGPGKGPGYGGPARGAGQDIPTIQTRAEFEPGNTVRAKTPWNQRKAELAEKAISVWESVIDDPDETASNRIVAADKIMNRVDGLPVARVVTPEHAPEWFITGPAEIESAAEWEAVANLASARPAGHGDD